jgi:cell shape-determining protein MreC
VVSGGYNHKLTMDFVTREAPVKEGDTVVTSGLGAAIRQAGHRQGHRHRRQPPELFQTVTVEPLASLARGNATGHDQLVLRLAPP